MKGVQVCTLFFSVSIVVINPASIDEEFDLCLDVVLRNYFNTRSILIYDMAKRTAKPSIKTLLPKQRAIDVSRIIEIASRDDARVSMLRDWNYNPSSYKFNLKMARFRPNSTIFIINEGDASNVTKLTQMFFSMKAKQSWYKQSPTLVIIKSSKSTDKSLIAMQAIQALWKVTKAVNVLVMVLLDATFFFYMWYPYRQPNCDTVVNSKARDVWNKGKFVLNRNLYPKKIISDLNGCPIKISTTDCLPYTYDFDGAYEFGFEMRLMRLLASHFNFTMTKVKLNREFEFWTGRLANGTLMGAFNQLDKQLVDLAFACLMVNEERYELAETLPSYYQDSITWFVPTPTLESHADNIYRTFSEKYWIIIVITTISSTFIFLAILKIEEIALLRTPRNMMGASLRVFAMALSSPITVPSETFLLRFFTFLFAIYSLHITTTYQASLFALYRTNSYSGIYNTIEEAVDAGLFIWLRPSLKNMYNQSDIYLWNKILRPGRFNYYTGNIDAALGEIADNKSAVALYIKTTMMYYIDAYYRDDDTRAPRIVPIPEQFASYPVSIFLALGHPMLELFGGCVADMVSAGLIEFWTKQTVDPNTFVSRLDYTPNVSLRMEHVNGAFMFYSFLIAFSSALFLIEFLWWLMHGKTVGPPVQRADVNYRRQLMFVAVASLARERLDDRMGRLRVKR